MRSTVDSIKERLDIVEVLGSYIKLEKAGKNFKARCPFHNEKTPSFVVSQERQNYYCFGCGAKGDIFTFVEESEGVDFKGALKILAERAGVEIEYQNGVRGESKSEKDKLYAVLEDATNFFESNLSSNPKIIKYLESRGVNKDSIKTWRLGFAPNEWRLLSTHLISVGHTKDVLSKAGLIKQGEELNKEPYDVFRGRIIFPLFDASGRAVAFSGRAIEKDAPAKYLNSPETALFNKSELLYGLDKAKDEIRKKNFTILVEGQIDLVLSHQAGVKNTVASSGTAFTQMHLERLKRLSSRIILAFDGDIAGEKASEKSAILGLSLGMEVKVAKLPSGQDPADLAQGDGEKWKEVLREAVHAIEHTFSKIFESEKDKRKIGKAIEKKVLPLLALLSSSIERGHFVSLISKRSGIREEVIWDDLRKTKVPVIENISSDSNKVEIVEAEETPVPSTRERIEERLLWLEELPDASEKERNELLQRLSIVKLEEERGVLHGQLSEEEDEKIIGQIEEVSRRIDEEKRKIV